MAIAYIYFVAVHWTSSNVRLSFTMSLISFRRTMIFEYLNLLLLIFDKISLLYQNVPKLSKLQFDTSLHPVPVPNLKIPSHRIE
ncbi:hypothetical protein V1478_000748 [Vespula squamosa]|uniref:Uncharacterized protein n=1 Tax=Vespula squamosa TaxID=30214 RepID=A0ABD2C6D5_VESSQ